MALARPDGAVGVPQELRGLPGTGSAPTEWPWWKRLREEASEGAIAGSASRLLRDHPTLDHHRHLTFP
jgi:hypothetical protein